MLFVSVGAILLTIMAVFVKILGERLHTAQLMFSRALIGFLIFTPLLIAKDGIDVIRTKRSGMHFQRGFWGACGNYCFFFGITHLVLADAMALQFSRPLFMILLAFLFLGEVAGRQRIAVTFAGFCGILIMLQPFGGGFDPNGIVAVAGAVFGGMVVISIKKLGTTEPTRRIIFYYAFYTTLFFGNPSLSVLDPANLGGSSSAGPDRDPRDHGAVLYHSWLHSRGSHGHRTVRLYADHLFRNFWGPSVRRGSKLVEHRRRDFDRWQ